MEKTDVTLKSCVCGKPQGFAQCCGRFLCGQCHARTPEQLMRSRFTAYALGGYGEYLLATWLPSAALGLSAEELSKKTLDWQRLDVIFSSQCGDNGVVEFKAWFYKEDDYAEMAFMHETSTFIRMQSRWFYVGAQGA